MSKHDTAKLERDIQALRSEVSEIDSGDDFDDLLQLILHRYWTTPAEFRLATAAVDAMRAQTKMILDLKATLITAGHEIVEAGERVGAAR